MTTLPDTASCAHDNEPSGSGAKELVLIMAIVTVEIYQRRVN
jgi:hypothetical protein